MTYLSLGEAAKAAGIAKGTLSKALKSGKLSYVEKTPAGYRIDPSELFRVFPPQRVETGQNERLATPPETAELAVMRVRLEAAEQRAADLARELDRSHEEKMRLLAVLPAPDRSSASSHSGFWSRLFGR